MGLFHKSKKQFDVVPIQGDFTVENQDGLKKVDSENTIYNYFDIMVEDITQHIILTSPQAISNVRYIQAVKEKGQIEVQIGVEEKRSTVLYHRYCKEQDARKIFIDFYHGRFNPDMKQYKLVEFL